ncbi:MAG: RHS repeat-associated core domain-containing protein, partial [Terracidiphilus sp.]
TLTWNALNQPISVNSTTATYDALGRMVEKGSGGTYTQFVYRPSGAMLAVYSGSLSKGTIPLPGGSTAIYNGTGLNYIRHKDWLGSSRLATTWSHTVYSKEAYAPFGETYNEAGTPDRSFTGQDQDVATGSGGSGVYDFLFRKYDPAAGRWLSPDPYGWNAVNGTDPQSLNRYAYVENQPLNAIDLAGLATCVSSDGTAWYDSGSDPCGAGWNPGDVPQSAPTGCDGDYSACVNGDNPTGPDPNGDGCDPTSNAACAVALNGAPTQGFFGAPNNDPCYNSQLASVGVGPAQLRQRIGAANVASNLFGLLGYASLVGPGARQDDKNLPQNHSVFGYLPNAVAAGNISFGVTCPFGAAFCQFAAGLAQTVALHPDSNGTLATGFDTPSDNAQIRIGQAMRAAGCHN